MGQGIFNTGSENMPQILRVPCPPFLHLLVCFFVPLGASDKSIAALGKAGDLCLAFPSFGQRLPGVLPVGLSSHSPVAGAAWISARERSGCSAGTRTFPLWGGCVAGLDVIATIHSDITMFSALNHRFP